MRPRSDGGGWVAKEMLMNYARKDSNYICTNLFILSCIETVNSRCRVQHSRLQIFVTSGHCCTVLLVNSLACSCKSTNKRSQLFTANNDFHLSLPRSWAPAFQLILRSYEIFCSPIKFVLWVAACSDAHCFPTPSESHSWHWNVNFLELVSTLLFFLLQIMLTVPWLSGCAVDDEVNCWPFCCWLEVARRELAEAHQLQLGIVQKIIPFFWFSAFFTCVWTQRWWWNVNNWQWSHFNFLSSLWNKRTWSWRACVQ